MDSFDFEGYLKNELARKEAQAAEKREQNARVLQETYKAWEDKLNKQLDHIHEEIVSQTEPENILKLAQAEMIITKIKERRFD